MGEKKKNLEKNGYIYTYKSPGVGNGNPLQYSCLGNPIDREAWRATVHEVPKSLTGLSTHSQHEFNSPEEVVNNADCCR